MSQSIALNMDCMEFMAGCKDKQFSLAVVDPPYALGKNSLRGGGGLMAKKENQKKMVEWDILPPDKYFTELKRVTENQIIWGGNYFKLFPARGFIVWDKGECFYGRSYGECELAYSSFNSASKIFKYNPQDKNRTHPTQKPVALYEWIFKNYAKAGDTILDTHGGSFSSRIAAFNAGLDYTGIELDADYFRDAEKRFKNHSDQVRMI
jgi:site-specific DNA-methyltransferase (adenine-specific)